MLSPSKITYRLPLCEKGRATMENDRNIQMGTEGKLKILCLDAMLKYIVKI